MKSELKVLVKYREVVVNKEFNHEVAPVITDVLLAKGNPSDRITFLKAVDIGDIPDHVVNEMDIVEEINSPRTFVEPLTYQFVMGYIDRLEEPVGKDDLGQDILEVCEVLSKDDYLELLAQRYRILSEDLQDEHTKDVHLALRGIKDTPKGFMKLIMEGGTKFE